MIHGKDLYKLLVVSILMLIFNNAGAQFVSKVVDYLPAPGQYTNAEYIGTPEAAKSIVGTNKGLVSLGAFGGSLTVHFNNGIQNDPANPYGVDFTIYGNPTLTWSEPGIVQVMKDENKNGIPDEIWYEIAGSDHFWNSTRHSYEITYQNSGSTKASDIHWADNEGKSGIIPENSFHQQPYYPSSVLFPVVGADNYKLKGTRISGFIDLSNPGVVVAARRAFGYADNTPVLSYTEKMPDNPYTVEVEGSGGDAIDISWAVDANRNPVHLDEIHFIRIYSGMNALAGWLGEISTEITGIRDVEPASVTGTQSMVVIQDLTPKIGMGNSVNLNAIVFLNGKPQVNTAISWSSSHPEVAAIENGRLTALKAGVFRLRASSASNPLVFAEKEMEVFSAGKAVILLSSQSLKVNDRLELNGKLTDQNGNILTGMTPLWSSSNVQIAEVVQTDGNYFLKGNQAGKCWIHLEAAEMKSISDSVQVEVFPESVKKKVYISVKTSEKTIVARQSVLVDQFDLSSKVDGTQKNYGLQDIRFVSLAHAIASAFQNQGMAGEWAFRDDAEGGAALYLWKVPELDEGSTVYIYGYGGSRSAAGYRKTWVVMHNQQPIVNGFDQIKVNNEDEILIYHLLDNSLPWTVTHLTSGSDSVKVNQKVEIQLKQYSCTMDNGRMISIKSSEVVAGRVIQAEMKNQPKITMTSDELGKASFTAEKSGEYLVSSGIDVARIFADPITGNQHAFENRFFCRIMPNPFSGSVRIDSPEPIKSIEVYNTIGKLVFQSADSGPVVDLSAFPTGIYIIRIVSGARIHQQKITKI